MTPRNNGCYRIVLTGGPGGGKTTAAELFRREIGDRVVVVPEAATILFGGGFPRVEEVTARHSTQQAIFHVQRNLEDVVTAQFPNRILICDRGTVDGAAYWPEAEVDFFTTMGTTLELELDRYDAVLFFESAAVGGIRIEGGNPVRNESNERAVELDRKMRDIYSKHPRFSLVPHHPSFLRKITSGLAILESMLGQLES